MFHNNWFMEMYIANDNANHADISKLMHEIQMCYLHEDANYET